MIFKKSLHNKFSNFFGSTTAVKPWNLALLPTELHHTNETHKLVWKEGRKQILETMTEAAWRPYGLHPSLIGLLVTETDCEWLWAIRLYREKTTEGNEGARGWKRTKRENGGWRNWRWRRTGDGGRQRNMIAAGKREGRKWKKKVEGMRGRRSRCNHSAQKG